MTVEAFRLAEHGMHGNGHMMMLEANSDEIAAAIVARLSTMVADGTSD